MTRARQQDRLLKEAMRETAFDWAEHNRRLDEALERWDRAERELSELHIKMARDVRKLLP